MANFLAIYDPVEERRIAFEKKCNEKIAIFEDLKKGKLTAGNFTVLWAANKRAPVSIDQSERHAAVVFGDAIRPENDERISAESLSREWKDAEKAKQNYYDGYYCAIRFDVETGFFIGGDILGLFPVYYFSNGEVTLAGSSPELFRHHESFKPKLCMEGLTGLLLTMHSVGGLTLWENVYRMQEGYLLSGGSGKKTAEINQYKIPLSQKYYGISFKRQLEIVHKKMGKSVARHAPAGQHYSLFFSGGLDSRMLAGYLKEYGKNVTAITLGKSSDQEMKMAKKAMNALPFEHTCIERSFNNYTRYAHLSAQWEHCLHGFNSIHSWSFKHILDRQESSRIITGIHHDGIFSGRYTGFLHENDTSEDVFSKILSLVTEWGISTDDLEELFSEMPAKDNVGIIVNKLRETFIAYSNTDYQRTWCYEMFHRGRFHHGGSVWETSFGAWPVLPIIDSALLEVLAGLPCSTKSNRLLQRKLVASYFPDLARIPLDKNNNTPEPILPTWQFLLKKKLTEPQLISRTTNAVKRRFRGPWHANLYYHRIYNINNAGWKSIRREAESGRSLTSDIFNQEKLLELLPTPEKSSDKRLGETSGMKSLLGFLLWLQNN